MQKALLICFWAFIFIIKPFYVFAESCSSEGSKQYKPSGSCSTQERTCCANGEFSSWGVLCPSSFECKDNEKPSTSQSCNGGSQSRTVYCDSSTGKWKTNPWGNCKCYSGFTMCNGSCRPNPSYDDDLYAGGPSYSSQSDANSSCPSYCQRVTARELVGGTGYANDTRCSGNAAPSQPCGCGAPTVCYTTQYSGVQRGGNRYYCECLLASYRCT